MVFYVPANLVSSNYQDVSSRDVLFKVGIPMVSPKISAKQKCAASENDLNQAAHRIRSDQGTEHPIDSICCQSHGRPDQRQFGGSGLETGEGRQPEDP
jgi:hypothetical protein